MSVENTSEDRLIYVTGFGPFAGHEQINASWEAVRLLPTKHTVRNQSFQLKLVEIPVIYDDVNQHVERIWKHNPKVKSFYSKNNFAKNLELNYTFPQLVIHCGVSGSADKIHIEKCAVNSMYSRPDWSGKCLKNTTISLKNNGSNCTELTTCIDVEKIVNELNSGLPNKMYVCSSDVGRYGCRLAVLVV